MSRNLENSCGVPEPSKMRCSIHSLVQSVDVVFHGLLRCSARTEQLLHVVTPKHQSFGLSQCKATLSTCVLVVLVLLQHFTASFLLSDNFFSHAINHWPISERSKSYTSMKHLFFLSTVITIVGKERKKKKKKKKEKKRKQQQQQKTTTCITKIKINKQIFG